MTTVISNCSKKKRAALDPTLHAGSLTEGSTINVATDWSDRLRRASPVIRGEDLYAGRALSDAKASAKGLGARYFIVSAGLGLVAQDCLVPAYSLTVARRNADSILAKTSGSAGDWWSAIQARSPFSVDIEDDGELILAALSSGYLAMVSDDWARWPAERRGRLRLFTKEEPKGFPEWIRQAWMPYDDRLDAVGGGHAGTQGDFAQRALRHYATTIGDKGALDTDRAAVEQSLEGLTAREVPVRPRKTDGEIRALIRLHWDAVDGRSGAMLRHLRGGLGIACEQGRFQALFGDVAGQIKNGEGR